MPLSQLFYSEIEITWYIPKAIYSIILDFLSEGLHQVHIADKIYYYKISYTVIIINDVS